MEDIDPKKCVMSQKIMINSFSDKIDLNLLLFFSSHSVFINFLYVSIFHIFNLFFFLCHIKRQIDNGILSINIFEFNVLSI